MASVSLIICAYTMDRWPRLRDTLARLQCQTRPPDDVVLVADHSEDMLAAFRSLGIGKVLENKYEPGVSGARNTGWRASSGDIVVFLDDDASPEPECIERLVAPLECDPTVAATSGWLVPDGGHVPKWYPQEMYWVFGCSWTGLAGRSTLRNPIGACMAWRRTALTALGGFSTLVGRCEHGRESTGKLRQLLGLTRPRIANCEETLMGVLATSQLGASVVHVEDAIARHYVGSERTTWRYLCRRAWGEGASKWLVRQLAAQRLADERRHALRVTRALLRNAYNCRRWRTSASLITGLLVTTAGYIYGAASLGRVTAVIDRSVSARQVTEQLMDTQ